ncbi:hypothetical protein ABPG77_000301 [Micractinium sp. CCAP 211/92]
MGSNLLFLTLSSILAACASRAQGFYLPPPRALVFVPPACQPCGIDGCAECTQTRDNIPPCAAGKCCTLCSAGYALSSNGTCVPNAPCLDDPNCLRCAPDGSCAECRTAPTGERRAWYSFLGKHGACSTQAVAELAAVSLLTKPCGYQHFQTVLPTGKTCSPCPSDCPCNLSGPPMCIPAGAELVSFGISRLDFARLGGLITFQNSTQSKKAICVLAFTSSPPKDCGPGRFLHPLTLQVTYSPNSRACYNCRTGRKASPAAGSVIVNTPGTPDPCPGCAPRAYCASCFACSGGPFCKYGRQCQCATGTYFDSRPTSKSAGVCILCSSIKPTCKLCQSCGALYTNKCVNGGLCQPP